MCKGICSYNLVYSFLIQLLSLKVQFFVVHFLNAFWHGNKAFPKGSSQNEIVAPLVVFHVPYRKYKGVKMCFYLCRYQNQNFSLVWHSCRWCKTRVALVSHSCRSCLTRVAFVSLVSGTRVVNQTRSAASDLFHRFTQSIKFYRLQYQHRCLENVIHQIDSKNGWLRLSASLRQNLGQFFVLTQVSFSSQQKEHRFL